ncbi:hypothetical protein IR152_04405 [Clostridioides sp. ES-S-0108-01]|uniref:hypothetical protein n=1 Tax=Clostridioides sp. ES-S-0108-01 TaxID=2770773 RepID=UPI001D0C1028|nr:hypothetical protein [Clostridioides sp. ES-S-0108-01]UDN52731.1 hypothetical protein JJC16_08985 [Clostridioides sp. ES-S-0107-01]
MNSISLQKNMYFHNNINIGAKKKSDSNINSIKTSVLQVKNSTPVNKATDIVNNLFDQRDELLEKIRNLKNGDDPLLESLHREIENLKKQNGELADKYKQDSDNFNYEDYSSISNNESSIETSTMKNSNYEDYNKKETLDLDINNNESLIETSTVKDYSSHEFKHILQSNEGYMKNFKENGKAIAELERSIMDRYRELEENSNDINSNDYVKLLQKQLNEIQNDISNLPKGSILDISANGY